MNRKPKILVVGSFVMDLIVSTEKFPGSGETVLGKSFRTAPGGKGANQAVQAARLGADVTMVGKVGGDSFGTDFYYSLRSSIAYAYDIDSSKDTGKEKLDKLILDSVQHIYEDMILQADDFSIVLNPVEKDWGFKIDTLVNSVKHINYDADNYERDIIYPLIITPIQKGKAINVSTAGGSKEGIIIKVDGRYFSITSNYKDIVEQDDTKNEWYGSQSATVKNNRNYFFDENEWLVAIKFATGANTYFSDDLKLYINEVQNDITYSDKTDDSDCVITYHRFSETEVEVADKGEILDTDSKTE